MLTAVTLQYLNSASTVGFVIYLHHTRDEDTSQDAFLRYARSQAP